jgi:hypothetical protein
MASSKCSPAVGAATEPSFAKHRLVAARVGGLGLPLQVGRQRHLTVLAGKGEGVAVEADDEGARLVVDRALHRRHQGVGLVEAAGEDETTTGLRLLRGVQEHDPGTIVTTPDKQHLDLAPRTRLLPIQAGRDDARVVDDEDVAGLKQLLEVGEGAVVQAAGLVEVQQARRRPLGEGMPGDALLGQLERPRRQEVEVGGGGVAHAVPSSAS